MFPFLVPLVLPRTTGKANHYCLQRVSGKFEILFALLKTALNFLKNGGAS
jgi:hypothetical protein